MKTLIFTGLLLATSLSLRADSPQPAAVNSATVPVPRNDWIVRHEGFNSIAKKGGVELLFLGDSITDGVMSKDLLGDLVHPTTAGYQIWADAMQPKLTELLKQ